MPMSARAIGCVFVLSVVILPWSASARGQQQPALDALLAHAGEYVQLFTDRFSNVVAEERYVQEFSPPPRRQALDSTASLQDRPMERALTSDFLLIRTQA